MFEPTCQYSWAHHRKGRAGDDFGKGVAMRVAAIVVDGFPVISGEDHEVASGVELIDGSRDQVVDKADAVAVAVAMRDLILGPERAHRRHMPSGLGDRCIDLVLRWVLVLEMRRHEEHDREDRLLAV